MSFLQRAAESLARKTSRRGFFGKGADVAFGALTGVAAGTALRPALAGATTRNTFCAFPGRPCLCDQCLRPDGVTTNGVCAKPCLIHTFWYANGCWTTTPSGKDTITCCDCDCQGHGDVKVCGCGSDYHNNPELCPEIEGL